MFEKLKYHPLFYIGLHLLIGALGASSVIIKTIYFISFFYAFVDIYVNKNKNEEALLWACYFVGAEVFFRMTKSTISYEVGKYSVSLVLIFGMVMSNRPQKFSVPYFIYFFLLLMGVILTDVPQGESIRKAIAFNITGPVVLFFSAFYFYKRNITRNKLLEAMYFMILPIFSMITYLYFKTPDLKEIVFSSNANRAASGGFGPNQVATIIGLGMFILAVFIFMKKKLSGYQLLDILFLVYFSYRGLLTFSRGGLLSAVIVFFVFVFFMFINNPKLIKVVLRYFVVSIAGVIALWLYTSDVTGGMIDNRYAGRNAAGKKKDDITAGRLDIMSTQLESFYDSPWFGIGIGNGKYKRIASSETGDPVSHNEVTRLIEEHGSIGIIILCILLYVPARHFYDSSNYQRAFLISFYGLWFLTIGHSAMRVAFPGFIYGLSLINITRDEEED